MSAQRPSAPSPPEQEDRLDHRASAREAGARSEPQASEVNRRAAAQQPNRPQADSDFAEAIRILDAERDALAALSTHRVALDDVARAFEIAADRRAGAIKVSVIP